jgi:hypothetical protein
MIAPTKEDELRPGPAPLGFDFAGDKLLMKGRSHLTNKAGPF